MFGIASHPNDLVAFERHDDPAHRIADPAEARLVDALDCQISSSAQSRLGVVL
jgi:hypothetical protein